MRECRNKQNNKDNNTRDDGVYVWSIWAILLISKIRHSHTRYGNSILDIYRGIFFISGKGSHSKVRLGYKNRTVSNHNFLLDYIWISQNWLNSLRNLILRDGLLIATFHTATVCQFIHFILFKIRRKEGHHRRHSLYYYLFIAPLLRLITTVK